ncbi:hypothetical protein CYMTET_47349 [Cymbomonas tetramitiformis]|uniref:Uncharacterized protein n=1 Tax=Cymbomonas tetramitiformis TaxID=36881 RepID=A0AAE0BUA6_9CHLO|nr:hypothetical protein CYMTET_47349 [Cymbomonas tetramitiformis]
MLGEGGSVHASCSVFSLRWDRLRGVAAKERRRVMAWATAARDMQQETRPGELAAIARPILPVGGALKGMDIRVSRPGGDFEEAGAEWRLDSKRGLVLEAKAKHCRTFDEWDKTFTVLMCKAP